MNVRLKFTRNVFGDGNVYVRLNDLSDLFDQLGRDVDNYAFTADQKSAIRATLKSVDKSIRDTAARAML